jgi:hypothetical protein
VAGLYDLPDPAAGHHVAGPHAVRIISLRADPAAHVGVDGEPVRADQHLARLRDHDRSFDQLEIVGRRHAVRVPPQQPLPIDLVHLFLPRGHRGKPPFELREKRF